jgi:hypothetical protein
MRKRLFEDKGFGDDVDRLVKAFVGLLHGDTEPGELVPSVTLADSEIEPPTR